MECWHFLSTISGPTEYKTFYIDELRNINSLRNIERFISTVWMAQRDIKGIASMFWAHSGQLHIQNWNKFSIQSKALTKAMIFVLEKALIFGLLRNHKNNGKKFKNGNPYFLPK